MSLNEEDIILYLNKLCDFLLCKHPYIQYHDKDDIKDRDEENKIPF